MTKPLVVDIEHPSQDPTVVTFGDVDVVELSSYPASNYIDPVEVLDNDSYVATLTDAIAQIEQRPGSEHLVTELQALVDGFNTNVDRTRP